MDNSGCIPTLTKRQEQAVAHLSLFAIDDWLEARDVAEAAGYGPDGRYFAQTLRFLPAGIVEERPGAFPLQWRLTTSGWALASELRGRPIEFTTRAEREADCVF